MSRLPVRPPRAPTFAIGRFHLAASVVLPVIGLIALSAFSIIFEVVDASPSDWLGLILLNWYSYYLIQIILAEGRKKQLASPLSLFAMSSLAYFGLTGILYFDTSLFVNNYDRDYFVADIIFVIAFTLAFHVSYLIMSAGLMPNAVYSRKGKWIPARVFLAVLILMAAGLFARLHIVANGDYLVSSIASGEQAGREHTDLAYYGFLATFPDISGWVLWIYYLSADHRNYRSMTGIRLFAASVILSNIVYWAPTGSKLNIAISIVVPIFCWYLYSRRIPKARYMAVVSLFLVLMFPITHILRVAQATILVEGRSAQGLSQVFDVTVSSASKSNSVREVGIAGKIFGRLDEHEVVAGAIRVVNQGSVDLRYGSDYSNAIINFVPRFILPNKIVAPYGNQFGHLIGMTTYKDIGTSIAPTYIGESYLNFGIFGFVVAPLLALVFLISYRHAGPQTVTQGGVLLFAGTISTILYLDGAFSLYISVLVRYWLVLIALDWLMRRRVNPRLPGVLFGFRRGFN